MKSMETKVIKMSIPHSVLAAGWIPFVVVVVLVILFSFIYIRFYQSRYESQMFSTITAILGLAVALFTCALVPIDIFLVSFMKNSTGHFKEWAKDNSTRDFIISGVEYAYYALYLLVIVFVFFILPMAYFFYEEKDDDREVSCSRKCWTAMKYSSVFLLFAVVLFLIGGLVQFDNKSFNNTSDWRKLANIFDDLVHDQSHTENALSFTISVLTTFGMIFLILYTATGMTVWPIDLIKGRRSVNKERLDVVGERQEVETQIQTLRNKYPPGRSMSTRDQRRLDNLQEKLSNVQRRERFLSHADSACVKLCGRLLRPIQLLMGVLFFLFAILVFISLILISVDRAMHSLGPRLGYALPEPKLPNPIDIILVYAQKAYPLDYILMVGLVLYFFLCSMSAIKWMGIWCCCFRMYRIRPRRTVPQGLLFLCFLLMFIVLATNILVYQIAPQYATFGSQHYVQISGNKTSVVLCDTKAPSDDCVMTRMAYLILRFCFKIWFFGAAYYWMTWVFVVVVVIGFLVAVIRKRRSTVEGEFDEDDMDDEVHLVRP